MKRIPGIFGGSGSDIRYTAQTCTEGNHYRLGKNYQPQRGGGHSAGARLGPTEPELCIQTGDLRSTRESTNKDLQQYRKQLALLVL